MLTADEKSEVDRYKVGIERNKARIKRLRVMADPSKDRWDAVKAEIEMMIKAAEQGRNALWTAESSEKAGLISIKIETAVQSFKSVIEMVDNAQEQIALSNRAIENYNRRISLITSKTGVSNG